jgi:hypothetical protein
MIWAILYAVGLVGNAYLLPRLTGQFEFVFTAILWPVVLPLVLMVKLAELGVKHHVW